MSEDEYTDLMTRLASNSQVVKGHTVQGELLSAGQFDVGVSLYSHTVDKAADEGAPVAWMPASGEPVQPIISRPNGIGLVKTATNPCAAMLFVDFELTGGQDVFKEAFRIGSVEGTDNPLSAFETYAGARGEAARGPRHLEQGLRGHPRQRPGHRLSRRRTARIRSDNQKETHPCGSPAPSPALRSRPAPFSSSPRAAAARPRRRPAAADSADSGPTEAEELYEEMAALSGQERRDRLVELAAEEDGAEPLHLDERRHPRRGRPRRSPTSSTSTSTSTAPVRRPSCSASCRSRTPASRATTSSRPTAASWAPSRRRA